MSALGAALGDVQAPAAFRGTQWESAAASAVAHAPYLARLIARLDAELTAVDAAWPEQAVHRAIADAVALAREPGALEHGMSVLRRAKAELHLACAIADLARAWPLARVTGALTDFADASLRAALALAAHEMGARGVLTPGADDEGNGPIPGFALIAMGKMGARELNYSSDIDFSVFFDAEALASAGAREPRVAAVRVVAPLVRALEEITPEGYVFRTDLRLRPDPGSTPVAVSIAAAAHYYQTLGQNWERAAFIKARAAAGDMECGRGFLAELQPFIWRKHLDFAAIADVKSIKRQILSAHRSAELDDPVFDLKLGRGGIRDIELFAQTQQLILGGRNRQLRVSGTQAALQELARLDVITPAAREALSEAYVFFREVEHRIQMLEDAQTHRVPQDREVRARLAALCGFSDLASFESTLLVLRKRVSEIDHELFGTQESLAAPEGSLIFTGVEDHPETLHTIAKLGFANPAYVSQTIRGWHHGRVRAMRSERARELLTALTPRLLRAFSGSGDPDQSFGRFASFFSALGAGVQVLSLFAARPALLDMLARLFALAPRLADELARRPALMDAMIEPRFAQPLGGDAPDARLSGLLARVKEAATFEERLNEARRFHREEAFRIGVQVIEGAASADAAGAAHADLAEACVVAMAEAASLEMERLHGVAPGPFAVLALGKFGGRELAEDSDLDIMIVYDAAEDARASGSGALAASDYATRLSQRLISALSAPTEEGALYDIDTQLRPSGAKGPVAVRLSTFERYYAEEAWTWEILALTRARPVAGDAGFGARVAAAVQARLTLPSDVAKVTEDARDMRARMARERRARSMWDLKLSPGGLVDIEFIAQTLQVRHAHAAPDILSANTGEAIARATAAGFLTAEDGATLIEAWKLWSAMQQVLRVSVTGEFTPEQATQALKEKLAAIGAAADFTELEVRIQALQTAVRAIFERTIGKVG
ncbi:MAG: bifunctional [glutamine synthetase] adenylyltransferase/[glutamine synthetase]-adenylyl-L-tyrosine phosphorylase [Hyphomonadaceae bacterium]